MKRVNYKQSPCTAEPAGPDKSTAGAAVEGSQGVGGGHHPGRGAAAKTAVTSN